MTMAMASSANRMVAILSPPLPNALDPGAGYLISPMSVSIVL